MNGAVPPVAPMATGGTAPYHINWSRESAAETWE